MEPNELLKESVSDIVADVKQGMDPHAAVVKTAKSRQLNVHFIKRACETLNVALTYNQFKKGQEKRAEDFPIVDPARVCAEVYSNTEKKAEFTSQYLNTPNFNRFLHDEEFKQATLKLTQNNDCSTDFPLSPAGVCEKSANFISRLERQKDELETKYAQADEAVIRNYSWLVNHFSDKEPEYRNSFALFEKQARALFSQSDCEYLDLIYKSAEINEPRGSFDDSYKFFTDTPELERFSEFLDHKHDKIKLAIELAHISAELQDIQANLKQAYQKLPVFENSLKANSGQKIETTKASVSPAKPLPATPEDPVVAWTRNKQETDDSEEIEYLSEIQRKTLPPQLKRSIIAAKKDAAHISPELKRAFDVSENFKGLFSTTADSAKELFESVKEEQKPKGSSIPSTSDLDNLERRLTLQKLIVTDPILANTDPNQVISAYKQFLRLAPELAKEEDVLKGALRTMVSAQALSPFDAKQFIDANTGYMKQKMLQEGSVPEGVKV